MEEAFRSYVFKNMVFEHALCGGLSKSSDIPRKLDKAVNYVSSIAKFHKQGDTESEQAIASSIFPRKLEYDGTAFRTYEMYVIEKYILWVNMSLDDKKNRHQIVYNSDVGLVSAKGFEPLTVCLEGRCSIQLSYAPIGNFEKITKTVGAAGFEPATSWSQTRRDDRTTLRPEFIFAAESKGFEPLVPFPVRMFSKHVLSASQATLLL